MFKYLSLPMTFKFFSVFKLDQIRSSSIKKVLALTNFPCYLKKTIYLFCSKHFFCKKINILIFALFTTGDKLLVILLIFLYEYKQKVGNIDNDLHRRTKPK